MDQKGFTLIEIITVIVILSVLAAFAVPRFVDLEQNAKQNAIDALKSEMNSQEALIWTNQKISAGGFVSDAQIFAELNLDLGLDYTWHPGDPKATGGTVKFKGESFTFSRRASTPLRPAVWTRK